MNAPDLRAHENPVADDSIQTYRLACHWRIITYLIAPPLIAVSLCLLAMPFLVESPTVPYFLIPVSIHLRNHNDLTYRRDYESASEGKRVTIVQRDGYFEMSWVVVNVSQKLSR